MAASGENPLLGEVLIEVSKDALNATADSVSETQGENPHIDYSATLILDCQAYNRLRKEIKAYRPRRKHLRQRNT